MFQKGDGRADFVSDHHVFDQALGTLRARTSRPADHRELRAIQAAAARFDQLDRRMAQNVAGGRFAAAKRIALGRAAQELAATAQRLDGLVRRFRLTA